MGEYQHKAIEGTVVTIDDRHTHSGKYIASARVRDATGKMWICTFWDKDAEAFMAKGLLNQDVYLEGGVKEENSITVRFFDGKKSAPKPKPKDERRYEPSVAIKEEDEHTIRVVSTDYRGMRSYCIKSKRDYVKVNGTWEGKMDYCVRVMGGKVAMDWLKEYKDDGKPGGVFVNPAQFKEKLKLMLDACQQSTGDYLEFYEEPK